MTKAQCNLMSKGDTLFAISFAPYAPETHEVVKEAKSKGLSVITLTDSQLSPLVELSDVSIKIKEAEIHSFRSLNGSMNIIQALMLGLIHHPTL
jgi:DNA-binding MurR/RpiR family transcriptional regulator